MTIIARSLSKKTHGTASAASQDSNVDVSGTANDRSSAGEGRLVLNMANSMAAAPLSAALRARRGDLKPADRDTFDRWARWVAAFYSLLAISLLGAMLLGAHTPAGRNDLFASHATAHSLPELPAPVAGSAGK
jgi:hypothetical protein